MRLAEEMLAQGKTVIVLVPELALTPQTMERFRERLGDCIAQLHSGLTAAQKADQLAPHPPRRGAGCRGGTLRHLRATG